MEGRLGEMDGWMAAAAAPHRRSCPSRLGACPPTVSELEVCGGPAPKPLTGDTTARQCCPARPY